MCLSRLWLLYWVSTQIRRQPAFTMLESAKSISRYRPPNGTAGLALSSVSGASRLPAPPARTIASTCGSAIRCSRRTRTSESTQGCYPARVPCPDHVLLILIRAAARQEESPVFSTPLRHVRGPGHVPGRLPERQPDSQHLGHRDAGTQH